VVTAWLALTLSTPESGCMRVVPGTHRAQVPHTDTFAETNMLSRGEEIAVTVNEDEAIDLVLAPGEMSLHHVLIFQGRPPNRASHPRIGLAIRHVPTHAHQLDGAHGSATLVRAEDRTGQWEHERPPPTDMHLDCVAHDAAVRDRLLGTVYRVAGGKQKLSATVM